VPIVSARPRTDYVGQGFNTAQSTASSFSGTLGQYGSGFDTKSGQFTNPRQFLAHFEIEVPAGVTIQGVRVTLRHGSANSNTSQILRMGPMARDGLWNAGGDGWATSNYPLQSSIPHPVEQRFAPNRYVDMARWHEPVAGYVDTTQGIYGSGVFFSQGDGSLAVDEDLPGLVSLIQAFLDDTVQADRDVTGSGTALSILLAWTGSPNRVGTGQLQGLRTVDQTTESNRPLLEIEFEDPNLAPSVSITSPADGAQLPAVEAVTLSAVASDPEDGDLSASVEWVSDLSGSLGSGATLELALEEGTHTITASITDSGGLETTDEITLEIVPRSRVRMRTSSFPAVEGLGDELGDEALTIPAVRMRPTTTTATASSSSSEPAARATTSSSSAVDGKGSPT